MLRGFAGRNTPATEVMHPLYAKALALSRPGQAPAVLIAVDNLILHEAFVKDVAQRLQGSVNLPRERLTFTVTHSHTTSALKDASLTLYGLPRPPEFEALVERYTNDLADWLEQVVVKALAQRKPARLTWGVGSSPWAHNRRKTGGPVDHDLPLLVIRDLDGKLRALYMSYACHCTCIGANKISGDWAGYAQAALQADHPGAVALVSIGCGADQAPASSDAARGGRQLADEVTGDQVGGVVAR
jgi:hypothetical protein